MASTQITKAVNVNVCPSGSTIRQSLKYNDVTNILVISLNSSTYISVIDCSYIRKNVLATSVHLKK